MLPILYQDEHFVVIDKPSGLLTHRTSLTTERASALQLLRDQLGRWVYPVHRLDRATSGTLLFALSPEATEAASKLVREKRLRKVYVAVVRGYVAESAVIDRPLKKAPGKPHVEAISRYSRLATAELAEPVGRYSTARYSLARVEIETGRLHQIRRHFAGISHPVIGDTVYGDGRHNKLFRARFDIHRLLLAATRLEFEHPYTHSALVIRAPLPREFVHLCEQLGWNDPEIVKNT